MRGVSWAWGRPMYPRSIWILSFIPFVGPFLSMTLLRRDTFAILADGVPSTMEPQGDEIVQSMTDQQAKSIMEGHSEAMSIGSHGFDPIVIVLLVSLGINALAILGLLAGR